MFVNDEYKFIKENGIFYIDKKLVNKMVSLLKIDYKSEFIFIELVVGEGYILFFIVKKYFIENKDKNKDE